MATAVKLATVVRPVRLTFLVFCNLGFSPASGLGDGVELVFVHDGDSDQLLAALAHGSFCERFLMRRLKKFFGLVCFLACFDFFFTTVASTLILSLLSARYGVLPGLISVLILSDPRWFSPVAFTGF